MGEDNGQVKAKYVALDVYGHVRHFLVKPAARLCNMLRGSLDAQGHTHKTTRRMGFDLRLVLL